MRYPRCALGLGAQQNQPAIAPWRGHAEQAVVLPRSAPRGRVSDCPRGFGRKSDLEGNQTSLSWHRI